MYLENGYINMENPMMTTNIMYSNATFPRWTHSELAFAKIDLGAGVVENLTVAHNATALPSQLSARVPALRAVMNCTTHPYISAGRNIVDGRFEVKMMFPGLDEDILRDAAYSWNYTGGVLSTLWAYKPGIVGYWTPAMFGAGSWPLTIGIFADIDASGRSNNLTVLTCRPYVEAVEADATFYLPSFDLTSPPVAIESTARYFNNDSYWAMSNMNYDAGTFDDVLVPVNLTKPSPLSAADSFFQALVLGIDAVADPRTLLGPENTENLINATEHLYRVIMAQCLNAQGGRRLPTDALKEASPQLAPGIIRDPNGYRLYQSPTATYLLIGLLAIMCGCASVVAFTFKPQGLLSRSPNSIASKAGLLAGAKLLDTIPQGAEWCSDGELEKQGVLQGLTLRLGWHSDGPYQARYGIDAVCVRHDLNEKDDEK